MTNRELDALVAERVMGWEWCGQSDRPLYLVPPQEADTFRDECRRLPMPAVIHETGFSARPGQGVVTRKTPRFTTDANDDYRVLEHVRETTHNHYWLMFCCHLHDLWSSRPSRGMDKDGKPTGGLTWIPYLIGDYSRAALAAMGIDIKGKPSE